MTLSAQNEPNSRFSALINDAYNSILSYSQPGGTLLPKYKAWWSLRQRLDRYERGGRVCAYRKSALDNVVTGLALRLGLSFTHHTLRRTCGRMMLRADGKLEEIAAVLGHSDSKTTMLYLGLDLEDQGALMEKYANYQKAARIPENGISGMSQQKDGPCGIRVCEDDWLIVQNSSPRNSKPGSLTEK